LIKQAEHVSCIVGMTRDQESD